MTDARTIELDASRTNELIFKINVEGRVSGPAQIRLLCEGTETSYLFKGQPQGRDGLVRFVIPRLCGMKQGTYASRVEVLIENRCFVPTLFFIEMLDEGTQRRSLRSAEVPRMATLAERYANRRGL